MNEACLIVYASMTGNTEEVANLIGSGIQEAGGTVLIKDILEVGYYWEPIRGGTAISRMNFSIFMMK